MAQMWCGKKKKTGREFCCIVITIFWTGNGIPINNKPSPTNDLSTYVLLPIVVLLGTVILCFMVEFTHRTLFLPILAEPHIVHLADIKQMVGVLVS